MTNPAAPDAAPSRPAAPPSPPWGQPSPWGAVDGPPHQRSRLPIYFALALVAVIAGSALFVSGFTLGLQSGSTPGTSEQRRDLFAPFWEAYNNIDSRFVGDVSNEQVVEGAIKGMFEALDDPFSAYMTSQEYRDSLEGISGEFGGIGAEMTTRTSDGAGCAPISETCPLTVVRVLPGSPALTAGLEARDVITAVDGETLMGATVQEAVERVRGPKGTEVRLSLERDGSPLELTFVRDIIQIETVHSEILADGTVGYLKIDGFSSNAADELTDQLRDFVEERAIRKLILDLRDDPGGFVDTARKIASQFIAEGPIFWEEAADGTKVAQNAESGGIATDPEIQLVVLVNGGSASASEILAAALQDTGRATLVGQTTFGKGTIQEWQLLEGGDAGGFRLSVKKWLTPDQRWIHQVGIEPDVVVTVPAESATETDPTLERALELLDPDPASV